MELKFEWDEEKRRKNLEKHLLDFIDARDLFHSLHIDLPSPYTKEKRLLAVGKLHEKMVTAVYTMRGEKIRIISFRSSRDEEKRKYRLLYE